MRRFRLFLVLTAVLSAMFGAVAAYLIMTVPNDIKAAVLLKEARAQIKARHNEEARTALSRLIQEYPRTDAAGAANVALAELQNSERMALARQVEELKKERAQTQAAITQLREQFTRLATTPPPAPPPPVVTAKPPVKAVKKAPARRRR